MAISEEKAKEIEALCRAMSVTRMVDYGMTRDKAQLAHRRVREGRPWDLVLEEMARGEERLAEVADDAALARESWHAAAVSLIFAQIAFNADGDRKREALSPDDPVLRALCCAVELPGDEGGSAIPAGDAVRMALSTDRGADPCERDRVRGMTGWSTAYRSMAEALCARGIACFLVDGPGQGEQA